MNTHIFLNPLVGQWEPTGVPKNDGCYTESGIVSFGLIVGCELGYPVAFTTVTIYLDWIAKDTGNMIV